mgnify:CR=1 FL=1
MIAEKCADVVPYQLQHSVVIDCYQSYDLTEPAYRFDMANSPADIRTRTLKLESELALCHLLRDDHPLVKALHAAQAVYIRWVPNWDSTASPDGKEAAVVEAEAIWSGIRFWITRHLGPIPEEALDSPAVENTIEFLHQCAKYPFRYLVSVHMPTLPTNFC